MSLTMTESDSAPASTTMARVVTLTPAPAVDRAYIVPELQGGALHRAIAADPTLAGKGINVSRALQLAGGITRAVLPLARFEQDLVRDRLTAQTAVCIDVAHSARQNIIIAAADGTTTNLNAPAKPLTQHEWAELTSATMRAVFDLQADWLVIAGTFPTVQSTGGLVDIAPLVRVAHEVGARVAVDTSGVGLRAMLAPELRIDLLKPNRAELADLVGRDLRTLGEVVVAAREVRATGVARLLVSLGSDGALLVDDHVIWATAPEVPVLNTTGAGDALLAGYLSASAADIPAAHSSALRCGVQWGAAAVQQITPDPTGLLGLTGAQLQRPNPQLVLR